MNMRNKNKELVENTPEEATWCGMREKEFRLFSVIVSVVLYIAIPFIMRYIFPLFAYNLMRESCGWLTRVVYLICGAVLLGWIYWAQAKRQQMKNANAEGEHQAS